MTTPPWEKEMQEASFRGVLIHVEARDESGGHNVATHEYIDSDDVLSENTGRKADGWSIDGYLWGDSYLTDLAQLRKALKDRTPAEWVDPWGGRYWVYAKSWTLRETKKLGGWVSIRLDLAEAGTDTAPASSTDTATATVEAAEAARPSILERFTEDFRATGVSLLGEDAALQIGDVVGTMSDLSETIANAGRPLAAFTRRASALSNGVTALLSSPSVLASRLSSLLSGLTALAGSGSSGAATRYKTSLALTAVDADWDSVTATTATRTRQAVNRDALATLVRQLALVEAAEASAEMEWATYDEAAATRSALTQGLTAEIRASSDDDLKRLLRTLSAAVTRDITVRGADLTRLSTVTLGATLPALVVAHRIFGDATRADEILSRNPAFHDPLAIPGEAGIEVAV